jgi:hypothetical protein
MLAAVARIAPVQPATRPTTIFFPAGSLISRFLPVFNRDSKSEPGEYCQSAIQMIEFSV